MPIAPAPAVLRAGEILTLLASDPGQALTVSELARQLGMPRATCDSVVQALAASDLVVRDDDLRYALGPGAIAIGDGARAANPVLRLGAKQADQFARRIGGCTALSVRQGSRSTVVDVFDHGPPFGLRSQPGQAISHVPPFGAAYVAWHDDEIADWMSRAPRLGRADRKRLLAGLDQVRRNGFSVTVATPLRGQLDAALSTLAVRPDADEAQLTRDAIVKEMVHREYLITDLDDASTYRVTIIAAPIFDRRGRAVASILLFGPDHEITAAEIGGRGRLLAECALGVTRLTGGTIPPSYPLPGPAH